MGHTLKIAETLVAGILFGANPPAQPQPTFIGAVVLTIALVVAVIVGWWNWREAHEEEATDSPEDLLASFEEAYEAGEIDEAEFKRVRAKLIGTPLPSSVAKPSKGEEPRKE